MSLLRTDNVVVLELKVGGILCGIAVLCTKPNYDFRVEGGVYKEHNLVEILSIGACAAETVCKNVDILGSVMEYIQRTYPTHGVVSQLGNITRQSEYQTDNAVASTPFTKGFQHSIVHEKLLTVFKKQRFVLLNNSVAGGVDNNATLTVTFHPKTTHTVEYFDGHKYSEDLQQPGRIQSGAAPEKAGKVGAVKQSMYRTGTDVQKNINLILENDHMNKMFQKPGKGPVTIKRVEFANEPEFTDTVYIRKLPYVFTGPRRLDSTTSH